MADTYGFLTWVDLQPSVEDTERAPPSPRDRDLDVSGLAFYDATEYRDGMADPPKEPRGRTIPGDTEQPDLEWGRQPGWVLYVFGVPHWGELLIVVLVVAFVAVFYKLGTISDKVDGTSDRVAKVEGKLDGLIAHFSRDLLPQAIDSYRKGDLAKAACTVDTATALIKFAAEWHIPVEPQFFQRSVNLLSMFPADPKQFPDAQKARVELANYRSSLEKTSVQPASRTGLAMPISPLSTRRFGVGSGLVWTGAPGLDMLILPSQQVEPRFFTVENVFLANGWQTLDNGRWGNVIFINMHIRYRGGTVVLRNVRFINCIFDVEPSPQGAHLAEVAALGQASAEIG